MSNDHVYLFCEWLSIHFTGEKRDVVKIRGPKEDVDKCHKHLMKIVKELNESSYVIEVPIYKQFHKFVIGKGGANIRKVRILYSVFMFVFTKRNVFVLCMSCTALCSIQGFFVLFHPWLVQYKNHFCQ